MYIWAVSLANQDVRLNQFIVLFKSNNKNKDFSKK